MDAQLATIAQLVTLSIGLVVVGVVAMGAILVRVVWLTRNIHANTEALMRGQEHIAELTAEVLRRTRP